MGHEGASTAFPQVIQGADLTGHFELVVMEETINGSPFGSQTMRSFKSGKKHTGAGFQCALLRAGNRRTSRPCYLQNCRQEQIAPVT
jgi:hypothetical protein